MPNTIFLRQPSGLATAVADHLLAPGSRDLSDTEVWIPTSGAARRIRRALATHGVLSPRLTQPMKALLPADSTLAARFEREAAWSSTLADATQDLLEPLFGTHGIPRTDADRLKAASVLCDLEDLLAEAALDLSSTLVTDSCPSDKPRWQALATLGSSCRRLLATHGLQDPNHARIASPPSHSPRRLVIACLPDLPKAAELFASNLESRGTIVDVLVWLPAQAAAGFDTWGRPDPASWANAILPIDPSIILTSPDAASEARNAMDFCLSSHTPGDYAIVLADPSSAGTFAREIVDRGGHPFLPGGDRLETTEPAIIALEWERFRASRDLPTLRRLLQLPHFNNLVRRDTDLRRDDALAACDHLVAKALLRTLDDARTLLATPLPPPQGEEREHEKRTRTLRDLAAVLVDRTTSLLDSPAPSFLASAWRSGGEGLEAARKVVALHERITSSPLFADGRTDPQPAFSRALRNEPAFEASRPGDVELPNWLEAPWIDASRLALCGCVQGSLPSTTDSHAFLPDQARHSLGLADNASRHARDAYLLHAIATSRPADSLRISLPRFKADGSPAIPSALLLRCQQPDLPARVHLLFNTSSPPLHTPPPVNSWRWSLPPNRRIKVEKISPTDFSEYLSCPFRHYLKRVLWLDAFAPAPREMDALVFGTLVHEALERFGTTSPTVSDPAAIESIVVADLDSAATRIFGPHPSPAVRIQLEGARERLRAFASIQAAQAADGWQIVSVERKLEKDDGLSIGPLKLSGKIDRIERNTRTGAWRVIDYKTHASPKQPAQSHLGSPPANEWVDDAAVHIDGRPKRWRDLQLPLYRLIARHWHGGEIGDAPLDAAYFTLAADPADSGILDFPQLNDDTVQQSAITCAEAVATNVAHGIFWPPQPVPGNWDDHFASLLLNGDPATCIDPDTIAFLQGNQ